MTDGVDRPGLLATGHLQNNVVILRFSTAFQLDFAFLCIFDYISLKSLKLHKTHSIENISHNNTCTRPITLKLRLRP